MAIRILTPPASEPVTVDEVVDFLRVDVEVDGEPPAILSALIQTARGVAEKRTARALITQTLELVLDGFPVAGEVRIPNPPLQKVEAITYRDAAGSEQTINPSDYVVDSASEPARLVPAPGCSWPATQLVPGAVRVQFVAGFGDEGEAVPAGIRTAMLMLVGTWWDSPEGVSSREMHELPFAVSVLLDQHRAHGWIG